MRLSAAGIIVMWRAVDTPYRALVRAWADAGFETSRVPQATAEEAVAAAAAAYAARVPGVFYRVRGGGFVVLVRDDGQFVPFMEISVRLSAIGRIRDFWIPEIDIRAGADTSEIRQIARWIRAEFARQLNVLSAWAVSDLLIDAATTHAHGVRLRAGVYFVPEKHAEAWREVCRTLSVVAPHEFFEIPVRPSKTGDEVIARAVVEQLAAAAASTGAVREGDKQETKRQALLTAEVESRLSDYEEVFADSDVISEKLSELRAGLAADILSID